MDFFLPFDAYKVEVEVLAPAPIPDWLLNTLAAALLAGYRNGELPAFGTFSRETDEYTITVSYCIRLNG